MDTETPEILKTPRNRVKLVAGLVVGTSVSSVVKILIRQNMTPKSNFQSLEMFIAAYAIGGMVAKQAADNTEKTIDTWADAFQKAKENRTTGTPETPA